jgi:hypothetical protein
MGPPETARPAQRSGGTFLLGAGRAGAVNGFSLLGARARRQSQIDSAAEPWNSTDALRRAHAHGPNLPLHRTRPRSFIRVAH